MGERAVIEKGMETLEAIGQNESTTFVLPQELTSLVGRYGKHLTGSDVQADGQSLDSLEFDEETRELLGLDDIEEILGQIEEETEMDVEQMEAEAQAIKEGDDPADIRSADEVIEEMDAEMETGDVDLSAPDESGDGAGDAAEGASGDGAGEREPETE
jgi:hypothetical protein